MSPLSSLAPLGIGTLVVGSAFAVASALPSASPAVVVQASNSASAATGHSHAAAPAASSGALGATTSTVPLKSRCDLGFNSAKFTKTAVPGFPHAHDDTTPVDFTLDEWIDVFVDESQGLSKKVVKAYIESDPVSKQGIMSGGLTHTLTPDPWNPMVDKKSCDELAKELKLAKATAAKFPTAADAKAAGYQMVTRYYPGIAAHYMRYDLVDGTFEIDKPEMLLFDGDLDSSSIAGLSYYVMKTGVNEPATGFTGTNDHYHRHLGLCSKGGVVVAGSSTSEQDCSALGGTKANGSAGWMSHLWIVPGCESDWGLFSGANPKLYVQGLKADRAMKSGCGTGKAITDKTSFGL